MSALSAILQEFSPDILPALVETMDPEEQGEFFALLEEEEHEQVDRLCGERVVARDRGPMFWLRTLTKTKNFHWQKQGLTPEESVAPFPYWPHPEAKEKPDWDYLDWCMFYMLDSFDQGYDLYWPKCREMMSSWEVVGYITWACQFFPNVQALAQSEKDDKAKGLIAYANALYENQPGWLKQRHPLKRGESGTAHEIEWLHKLPDPNRKGEFMTATSQFIAVPQGERQTASYHPTIFFNDESAHQAAWKATLNIVKPVAKQIICVSSAAFSDFGLQCDPSLAV